MNKYQENVMRTAKSSTTARDTLSNIALGIAGEAGEVADIVKKHLHHGHSLDEAKVVEELGDVLFYISWMASQLNVTLEYVADTNIAKLQRRYPEGFTEERSINRDGIWGKILGKEED